MFGSTKAVKTTPCTVQIIEEFRAAPIFNFPNIVLTRRAKQV